MSFYLVDYENTQDLSGIDKLSEQDTVIIFYSPKINSLSFDLHKEILSSKAKIEYKYVETGGKNALDFQLSTYLGFLIDKSISTEDKYYIVSNDKGFLFVASFWKKEKSIKINIIPYLKATNLTSAISETDMDIKNILIQSNIALSELEVKEIINIVSKYKTTQTINGYINKLLKDSTKSGAVLKLVKPFIIK